VKVNAMLLEIGRGLLRVPLENHAGSLQSGSASLGLPNTALSCGRRPIQPIAARQLQRIVGPPFYFLCDAAVA
jgi:hypothetical protein